MVKAAAATLITVSINLLIRRYNPELSIALSLCAVASVFIAAMGYAGSLSELVNTVKIIAGSENQMIMPVMKCLAIALVTKISAELCKDASQSSCAAAIEFAGTVCAMTVAMPMMISMLKMVGSMV